MSKIKRVIALALAIVNLCLGLNVYAENYSIVYNADALGYYRFKIVASEKPSRSMIKVVADRESYFPKVEKIVDKEVDNHAPKAAYNAQVKDKVDIAVIVGDDMENKDEFKGYISGLSDYLIENNINAKLNIVDANDYVTESVGKYIEYPEYKYISHTLGDYIEDMSWSLSVFKGTTKPDNTHNYAGEYMGITDRLIVYNDSYQNPNNSNVVDWGYIGYKGRPFDSTIKRWNSGISILSPSGLVPLCKDEDTRYEYRDGEYTMLGSDAPLIWGIYTYKDDYKYKDKWCNRVIHSDLFNSYDSIVLEMQNLESRNEISYGQVTTVAFNVKLGNLYTSDNHEPNENLDYLDKRYDYIIDSMYILKIDTSYMGNAKFATLSYVGDIDEDDKREEIVIGRISIGDIVKNATNIVVSIDNIDDKIKINLENNRGESTYKLFSNDEIGGGGICIGGFYKIPYLISYDEHAGMNSYCRGGELSCGGENRILNGHENSYNDESRKLYFEGLWGSKYGCFAYKNEDNSILHLCGGVHINGISANEYREAIKQNTILKGLNCYKNVKVGYNIYPSIDSLEWEDGAKRVIIAVTGSEFLDMRYLDDSIENDEEFVNNRLKDYSKLIGSLSNSSAYMICLNSKCADDVFNKLEGTNTTPNYDDIVSNIEENGAKSGCSITLGDEAGQLPLDDNMAKKIGNIIRAVVSEDGKKDTHWILEGDSVIFNTTYDDEEQDIPYNLGQGIGEEGKESFEFGESKVWSIYMTDAIKNRILANAGTEAEKWIFKHNKDWFDNSSGEFEFNKIAIEKPPETFTKVGLYRVNYRRRDNPLNDNDENNAFANYRKWSNYYNNY